MKLALCVIFQATILNFRGWSRWQMLFREKLLICCLTNLLFLYWELTTGMCNTSPWIPTPPMFSFPPAFVHVQQYVEANTYTPMHINSHWIYDTGPCKAQTQTLRITFCKLKLYIGQQGSWGGALVCNPKWSLCSRKYLIWSCMWDYCRDCMSRERQRCRTPSPQRLHSKQWGRRKTHWRTISVHLCIRREERRTGV